MPMARAYSYDMPTNDIGTRIRSARKAAQLSCEELGHKAGTTGSTIYRIETGRRNPRNSTVVAIATALDVDVTELTAEATA
jgi:transcriptional regulator with XRE-family HTH domain